MVKHNSRFDYIDNLYSYIDELKELHVKFGRHSENIRAVQTELRQAVSDFRDEFNIERVNMKICISGSQNLGKSTFIKDIIDVYPYFRTPSVTYRNVVKDNNLNINKKADIKGQSMIFNKVTEELLTLTDGQVILDRCLFDAYIYSKWSHLNNPATNIDATFLTLQLEMAKFYSAYYDYIIFIPMLMDGTDPVMEEDGLRETDASYRIEVDELFNQMYSEMIIDDPEFAKKLIYINGTREERMQSFKELIEFSKV